MFFLSGRVVVFSEDNHNIIVLSATRFTRRSFPRCDDDDVIVATRPQAAMPPSTSRGTRATCAIFLARAINDI